MSIFGKPTDQDLDQYPPALLTSPHEWDPSVLNYAHPNKCGYPSWVTDPSVRDQHDPRIDECGNIHNRVIHTLSLISDTPSTSIKKHDQQPSTIDYNKLKSYFGWANADTIENISFQDSQLSISHDMILLVISLFSLRSNNSRARTSQ